LSGSITNAYIENSIIWANSGTGSSSNYDKLATAIYWFTNCCTAPDPGESSTSIRTNCVFSDPQFADLSTNNARLKVRSPCINAGINRTWMDSARDLDGRPRIDRVSRRVDMGAYEYLPQVTLFMFR